MTAIQGSDQQSYILQQLHTLVSASQVIAGEDAPKTLHDRLSMAIAPQSWLPCIVYPNTQEELVEIVQCSAHHHWRMMPLGNGSKIHWGGLGENIHLLISTEKLNRLIDHAVGDLTITAEAGMPFHTLTETLQQQQQQVGLDPAYADYATLGGVVATGDTGALRQRHGGVRDRVIGISFVRADGTLAQAGGRVVKNVAGYDLMKLMTGAYGTLGIISQLTFRVYPRAETSQTAVIAGNADSIQSLVATVLASSLTPHRFDVLSPALLQQLNLENISNSPRQLGLAIQFESIFVSVDQQTQQLETLAKDCSLSITNLLKDEPEAHLWRQLQDPMHPPHTQTPITCKMGVLPSQAIATLKQLPHLLPTDASTGAIAHIHASSGLGRVQFNGGAMPPTAILPLRQWCNTHSGFLSVLEAPPSWKQQLDVWGYSGNALPLMQRLKTQFDPHHLLNPGRFLHSL